MQRGMSFLEWMLFIALMGGAGILVVLYVNPDIQENISEGITSLTESAQHQAVQCSDIEVYPVSCIVSDSDVQVILSQEDASSTSGIVFQFETPTGIRTIEKSQSESSFMFTDSALLGATEVAVASIHGDEQCPWSTKTIACTSADMANEGICALREAHWIVDGTQSNQAYLSSDSEAHIEATGLCQNVPVNVSIYSVGTGSALTIISSRLITLDGHEASFDWAPSSAGQFLFKASTLVNITSVSSQTLQVQNITNLGDSYVLTRGHSFCTGNGNDKDYLYNLNVSIWDTPHGETFEARRSDGKLLRKSFSSESFMSGVPNALDAEYSITPTCGGATVTYTISNPSSDYKSLAGISFNVDGIMQTTSGTVHLNRIYYSEGYLPLDQGETIFLDNIYPLHAYSPVIVHADSDFAVGSSFAYPFLDYEDFVTVQLEKVTSGEQSGSWRHRYYNLKAQSYDSEEGLVSFSGQRIAPGETRTYTLYIRFTEPRYYILTLEPYKTYFNNLYGPVTYTKNLDPVFGTQMGGPGQVSSENPRGYWTDQSRRIDLLGWQPFVDYLIDTAKDLGFSRVLIWNPSGLYDDSICTVQHGPDSSCNYPSAFMDFDPSAELTKAELSRLNAAGVQLGFWWGRSSQIPTPNVWNPVTIVDADYDTGEHTSFLHGQLSKAQSLGARLIGMDSFNNMKNVDKYSWVKEMREQSGNQILFTHEPAGSDIFTTVMAQFVRADGYNDLPDEIKSPNVLAKYLHDNKAEIQIWIRDSDQLDEEYITRLMKWGYTPVIMQNNGGSINFDDEISEFDQEPYECNDGKDNDGKGRADFPYDPECVSTDDENEAS